MRAENMGKAAYENTSSVDPSFTIYKYAQKNKHWKETYKDVKQGIGRYIFCLTFFCNVHIF